MKNWSITSLLTLLIIFNSCQQDDIINLDNQSDKDLIVANQLVEDFFNSLPSNANVRVEDDENEEYYITVLRYDEKYGRLVYNTSNGESTSNQLSIAYQTVGEETITATVAPGQYVFWYAGEGLKQLREIDFDDEAEDILEELPEHYEKDQLWYIKVPEADNETLLKYDIIYQIEGSEKVIRLDPKLKIKQ